MGRRQEEEEGGPREGGGESMQNDKGECVDLFIPRKCSWTNRIIGSKDHSSIQINIAHLDESGVITRGYTTFALSGEVREKGESDSVLDLLWNKARAEVCQ